MGLHQGDSSRTTGAAVSAWLLPAVLAGVSLVLALLGDSARDWLRYERAAIADGEFWRLLSGHFVHLGFSHLLLNIAGLALVWYLVGGHLRMLEWLLVALVAVAGMDAGFWFFEPQLVWYVGLSGLLHALLAAGIVAGFRHARNESLALALILVGKLVYEQVVGPMPGSQQSAGGAVVVMAHLYGAIAGTIVAAGIMIRVHWRPPI